MGFLATISEDDAAGDVARLYAAEREDQGFVANYVSTFSLRPAVYAAWDELNAAIKASSDGRRYRVATLAAARELRSSYCALAHGQVFATEIGSEESLRDLMSADDVRDRRGPADAAVADLATKVARDAPGITDDDYRPLRELGFTDAEIMDVILAAAARCFFSTVLDATGTLPDAVFNAVFDDRTRAALVVGRPIASG